VARLPCLALGNTLTMTEGTETNRGLSPLPLDPNSFRQKPFERSAYIFSYRPAVRRRWLFYSYSTPPSSSR
jgi:hypothetical protein